MSARMGAAAAVERFGIEVDGRSIETAQLGYLLDPAQWDECVAEARESIALGPDHWLMIRLVCAWFDERQSVPEARWLLKAMQERLGEENGTRYYCTACFRTATARDRARSPARGSRAR